MILASLLLGALLVPVGPSDVDKEVRVELKDLAKISASNIRLEDVAEIHGPAEEVLRLRQLSLGTAPDPGLTRTISRTGILLAARRSGLGLGKERLAGAEKVVVETRYEAVPGDAVLEAAMQFLRRELGKTLEGRRVEVQAAPPSDLKIPAGGSAPRYLAQWVDGRKDHGSVKVEVRVEQDGRLVAKPVVVFEILAVQRALRLLRDLAIGEFPRPEDLSFTEIEDGGDVVAPLADLSAVEGAVLRRPLKAGSILALGDFERPVLVKRGDPVTLIYRQGGLEVQLSGVALATGRSGEQVRVLNPASQREVQAQLVGRTPLGGAIARVY